MADKCSICSHKERLEMERAYIQGGSFLKISKTYDVAYHGVRNHMQNHLSRQMLQAYERKQLDESFDILGKIDSILSKTEIIFQRNYDKKRDVTALKAVSEQRNILELLAKISYTLHQTRQDEIAAQEAQEEEQMQDEFDKAFERLTLNELKMLDKLREKINGESFKPVIHDSWNIDEFRLVKPEVRYANQSAGQKAANEKQREKQREKQPQPEPVKQYQEVVRPIPSTDLSSKINDEI